MITEEERREIVNQVKEELLLMIPDVIGNLIMNHVGMIRMNKKFYEDNPDLAGSKDVVASVVEMVEGENPGMDYQAILDRAIPLIKARIKNTKNLNMTEVKRPNRNLSSLTLGNGEL